MAPATTAPMKLSMWRLQTTPRLSMWGSRTKMRTPLARGVDSCSATLRNPLHYMLHFGILYSSMLSAAVLHFLFEKLTISLSCFESCLIFFPLLSSYILWCVCTFNFLSWRFLVFKENKAWYFFRISQLTSKLQAHSVSFPFIQVNLRIRFHTKLKMSISANAQCNSSLHIGATVGLSLHALVLILKLLAA